MKRFTFFTKSLLIALFCWLAIPAFAQRNTVTDENITTRVSTELTWQMDVPGDDIDVTTKDGIVMLDGSVDNLLAKERAANVAGAVRGVRGVVNKIKVDPPFVPDLQLAESVEQALLDDPAADSYEIKTSANLGTVTLTGTVESWTEKELAGHVAKSVKGVKDIQNSIEVKTRTNRPDNEIKREVTQAINNDIRLYPRSIDVNVKNGKVSLSGTVGSLNDLHLAKSYAWTTGVSKVDIEALKIENWADNVNLRNKTYAFRSDDEIKKAVEDAFLHDPRVLSFNPNVSVNNGVVTLSGIVNNLRAKRAAESDAQNMVGVLLVKNNLKVRPDNVPSDSDLIARVENALGRNAEVDRYDINVAAWKGKVYLNGIVDSYYEMYRAEDVASNVKGVKEVVNNLNLYNNQNYDHFYPYGVYNYYYPTPYSTPGGYYNFPLTDTQIKQNIEDELWWSPFVNEYQVSVDVTGGVATLTGDIDSWRERNAAIENAYEGGAHTVVDKLMIDTGSSN